MRIGERGSRRFVAAAGAVGMTVALCAACGGAATQTAPSTGRAGPAAMSSAIDPASADASPTVPAGPPGLSLITRISGHLTPKSVVASDRGLVFAQNMIYSHSMSVFDRNHQLVKTISDGVDLADFGITGHPGISRGGPVEAAFTPDGTHLYVSNYSMYGNGWTREGHDTCSPSAGYDPSTVYRIDVSSLTVDQVIPVGVVPKFLAVSPDGRRVVVSDWCSYAASVIDSVSGQEIARVPTGPYPRGVAISPDSRTAYIAVMGGTYVRELDLSTNTIVGTIHGVGSGPRHLVLDPTGRTLYVTLNGDGVVAKVDIATGTVLARTATGDDPRSMAISKDGRYLYVVNYFSNDVSKLRVADFAVVQTVRTDPHPIGVTVDTGTGQVWVACYGGTIEVFQDR